MCFFVFLHDKKLENRTLDGAADVHSPLHTKNGYFFILSKKNDYWIGNLFVEEKVFFDKTW